MAKTTKLIPRGRTFTGTIIKAKAQQTATMEFDRRTYVPKYERYQRARTRLTVHNPPGVDAVRGDIVQVQECRPLSKTKSFVILKVLGRDRRFLEAEERKEKKDENKKEAPKQEQ